MKTCSSPHCDRSYPSHKWGQIRAHSEGWFEQKDGTTYCPDHVPAWVSEWRNKRKKDTK